MPRLRLNLDYVEEQREFFLWKFADVHREDVRDLEGDFKRFSKSKNNQLEVLEAMLLLEHRGSAATASTFNDMLTSVVDHDVKALSFIQLCCIVFQKDIDLLNDFVSDAERQLALDAARNAAEEARMAEYSIQYAKEAEEAAAQERAMRLEAESKMTGVAGISAFFKRRVEESSQDQVVTNEQRIKEEAARRREVREAKRRLAVAVEAASRQRTAEEMKQEVVRATIREAATAAAAAAKKKEEERTERAARKAALNSKWTDAVNTSGSPCKASSSSSSSLSRRPQSPTSSAFTLSGSYSFPSPSASIDLTS